MRKRFPGNTNLHLYEGEIYKGLPLMPGHSPFIEEHLEGTLTTIQRSLSIYPRLFAVLFVLRYPEGYSACDSKHISRFWQSINSKVECNRARAMRDLKRAHDSDVHYVWAKEYSDESGMPHYHCLLLVNQDAFCAVGDYNSPNDNFYNRVTSAWAGAIGINPGDAKGLAYFVDNGAFHINAKEGDMAIAELFRRCSYFCKAATKRYGGLGKAFSCSRFDKL